jgi:hypothetical protein
VIGVPFAAAFPQKVRSGDRTYLQPIGRSAFPSRQIAVQWLSDDVIAAASSRLFWLRGTRGAGSHAQSADFIAALDRVGGMRYNH